MLSKPTIWRRVLAVSSVKSCQRYSSFQSVHNSFPATMYRFQLRREPSLFNNQMKLKEFAYPRDGVEVADDGLVYPILSATQNYSRGPVFRPNTTLLQELLRNDYDFCQEEAELSGVVTDPHVVCIKKGTTIPTSLQLVRKNDQLAEFSLQPSHPMTLGDFNNTINEFYSKSAVLTEAMEWMESHDFYDTVEDVPSEDWMKS